MPRKPKLTTAERIRAHRREVGESQKAFAERLGLTQRVIEHTERGGTPRAAAAKTVADELGVKVATLWP